MLKTLMSAMALCLGMAGASAATNTYDWSFCFEADCAAGRSFARGTLTTEDTPYPSFVQVTSITGSLGEGLAYRDTIRGLLAPGTASNGIEGTNDNRLYYTEDRLGFELSDRGLGFGRNGSNDTYVLYFYGTGGDRLSYNSSFAGRGTFTLSPTAPVPEPGTVAMFALGLAALPLWRRRIGARSAAA